MGNPVENASRLLTKAERNYSTTECEALGVVLAVGRLWGCLEDAKIPILTDYRTLPLWACTMRPPSLRIESGTRLFLNHLCHFEREAGRRSILSLTPVLHKQHELVPDHTSKLNTGIMSHLSGRLRGHRGRVVTR